MSSELKVHSGLQPSEPLYKRAPSRDENGKSYSDLMMLIPKLNKRSPDEVEVRLARISQVLDQYKHVVVFADLNLKINVLWISFVAVPGLTYEISAAIKQQVPEASLVADQPQ
ncbi:MAG: hypothetical protein OEX12_04325 [Gammaproteobacteria bacterium]|nr:hypothetical protein [Gammaproteobacteria bacterium]